ncbi:MAG TPA: ABC transporter permease [Candidatus Acidoferrales bacterium]|nr:ABC transporter permease [Candidatus Acidoferrales bacterium]
MRLERWFKKLSFWLRLLLHRRELDQDLDDEIAYHLEAKTEENVARGMLPEEARRAARIELGGVEQAKENMRSVRTGASLEMLFRDVRFAARMFRKNLGFTAVAVLTLAVGVGANTAVFSVLYRDLLHPLPYPDGNRLVFFGMVVPSADSRPFLFTAFYEQFRSAHTPFESITSWRPGIGDCDLTEDQPLRLACVRAESTFLPTFGIVPAVGSNFSVDEDGPDARHVCLISYALWQSRFDGSPSAVGQMLSIDAQPTRVIGVLPRNFEWPTLNHIDVVLPEALTTAELTSPMAGVVRSYARLKPGVSLAEARAQLGPAMEEWRRISPPMFRREMRLGLLPVREDQVGSIRPALLVLFGASLAIMLLGTANVATLSLARGAAREHEFAVRAALGASRSNVMRLQLAESTLLGLFGGATGAGIAFALLRLFIALAPEGIPRIAEAGFGVPLLTFALGASLLSGLICGLISACIPPPAHALHGGSSLGPHRARLGGALVAAQVAMSFVLVIEAGLFLETLRNIESVPLGMETKQVVTAEITLGQAYTPSTASELFARLEAGLRSLPGVTGAAVSDSLPPSGGERAHPLFDIQPEGRPAFPKGTGGLVGWRIVTPGYFQILGIPFLKGHAFIMSDQNPNMDVAIINEKLAQQLFPSESAIGQHIQLSVPAGPWYTIVGVCGDMKYLNQSGRVEPSGPEYYLPRKRLMSAGAATDSSDRHEFFLVRSPMKSTAVEQMLRSEIASLDPTLPAEISTLTARVDVLRVEPRFNAALISLFATLGFVLAAIGLYGVVSFLVAARTKEIGVRMALGASPQRVLGIVIARGFRLILAGLVVGIALAFAFGHVLQGLLYGVSARDPVIAGIAALLLLIVGLAACYIPARKAMRVDPMVALRYE